jgi:NADH-quinone oxidoreductase subunit A
MRDVHRSLPRLAPLASPAILLALAACGSEQATAEAAAAQGPAPLWPLAVYAAAALVVAAAMIGISHVLGQRHSDRETSEPYESGVSSTGTARLRFSAHFYLIAMLFVIFDIEAVFLFAWAVAYRDVGWPGYLGALVFIAVLSIALLYEWRLGALDWSRGKAKGKR